MSKEMQVRPDADPAWVEALSALPDPGVGKRLIVYVRASSVRLHVLNDEATIQEQDGKAGGGDK